MALKLDQLQKPENQQIRTENNEDFIEGEGDDALTSGDEATIVFFDFQPPNETQTPNSRINTRSSTSLENPRRHTI